MLQSRTTEDYIRASKGSLVTLGDLTRSYDNGNYQCSRDMATVIWRLLTVELRQARMIGKLNFLSIIHPPNPRNLLPHYSATAAEVNIKSDGSTLPVITVTHVPQFIELTSEKICNFTDYWNSKDSPIIVAGSVESHLIPTDTTLHTPFHKRRRISRYELITTIRNKAGSHYDKKYDQFIENPLLIMDVTINMDNGVTYDSRTRPDLYVYKNTSADAAIRHIAFEILKSSESWNL